MSAEPSPPEPLVKAAALIGEALALIGSVEPSTRTGAAHQAATAAVWLLPITEPAVRHLVPEHMALQSLARSLEGVSTLVRYEGEPPSFDDVTEGIRQAGKTG